MHTSAALLLELGIVLACLGILGTLARRISLSPVPLYLLTGVALSEGGITSIPDAGRFVDTGASLGMVLLLLVLGLEFTLSEFTASLRRHVPSAAVDLALNTAPGAAAGLLLGLEPAAVLALAGVTYISSSGLVARLLGDLRRLGNRETPAVLSVLVLEDFAMAAYLPVLVVVVSDGTWPQALIGVLVATSAVAVAFAASYWWGHHLGKLISHPEPEQLLLRVMGLTLVVAALAETVHVSAAVGAFLVGLALTGEAADRARTVLVPLRDLFAAVFFLAIGLSVSPGSLPPVLPAAAALAALSAMTKTVTGWYAASREEVGSLGRLRAGTALIAHGEFSVVIVALAAPHNDRLGPLVTAYVLLLAVAGPLATHLVRPRRRPPTTGKPSESTHP